MVRNLGITIFLTTHYLEEADQLCSRVAIIDLGKIIATGTPADLKSSIGGDVINLSPCKGDEMACSQFMADTQKVLEGESFVQRIQPAEEELALYVDNAKTAAPAIMRILADKGIEVETLAISHPSLDDVFLKYTGRTIRHQEGQASSFSDMARRSERRNKS
jgi:ABC-2 type transport system ATP-binding protein